MRTCVGCRERFTQWALVRFVRGADGWTVDAGRTRAPGRGAYLCSATCAERVTKNRRYPGLASAALSDSARSVYDSRVPKNGRSNGHEVRDSARRSP